MEVLLWRLRGPGATGLLVLSLRPDDGELAVKAGSHDVHRNYPESRGAAKMRATPIEPRRSYSDPGVDRAPPWMTPTIDLNQEYIDAGATVDKDTPLCWGLPGGEPCRRVVVPGTDYCEECNDG